MRQFGPDQRALIDAFDEPALIVDRGMVALANLAALDVLGGHIEDRDVRLAIRNPVALDAILRAERTDIEVTGIVEHGRPWLLSVRPFGDSGVLVRMFDRADVVAAEKMRVDFVANASHELRTPLSTVLGYAETLAEETDLQSELRANFGRTIRDEARRMLRIIEDLMSLSRIEADRFIAPAERVQVEDVVKTCIANAGQLRGGGRREFEVEVEDGLPALRGDRGQLIQLLDNLIGNAVRYGCDRAGSQVEVKAVRDGRWILLSVTDRGPGIPRQHLPRVTERFYRVDAARSRESGGTGLGLAIVKHIVERHKGSLEIASTLGVGTTVSVRLPVVG